MQSQNKNNKRDIIFLVIIGIAFLFPTLLGFVIYALPKFLISRFLRKNKDAKYRIMHDTTMAGLVLGVLYIIGNLNK